ncbi:MAG: TetR/AcrR family transcriptional regulator [Deltaproteobacteria bacterium]|nr:TetR/AcrR family transcriptional regulator [Deltaproteobacteria bacterium]
MKSAVDATAQRRSLGAKGRATRAAILEAAHEVFKAHGYYGSSVSEITRRCGVSIGTFYQYFRNKEQVFLELHDVVTSRFLARSSAFSGGEGGFLQSLRQGVRLLCEHMRDNFAFHRILGESELIDGVTISYYEAVARLYRDLFRNAFQAGEARPLDPNLLAYGLTGICYFHAMDWGPDAEVFEQDRLVEMITDFVWKGISGSAPWDRTPDWDLLSMPEPRELRSQGGRPLTRGQRTRRAIFQAAEKILGLHGINGANISDITREAGVAQGTFYVHFKSKADLVEGLVKYLNHQMRVELQRYASVMKDRRDVERVGILAFFRFLKRHREIYRIVPECEMISRPVTLWYYNKTAEGYVRGLRRGMERGQIRDLPPVFLARTLMGLTHFAGLKWVVWNPAGSTETHRRMLEDLLLFALYGVGVGRG